MSAPVFLAAPEQIVGIRAGDSYRFSGPEARHAAVVQRRGPGATIELVDGAGTRLRATITEVIGAELFLQVVDRAVENKPVPELTILQGLIKSGAQQAVASMTETGVDVIVPWASQRSIAKWTGPRAEKSREKWQVAAREAAKQARRAYVPEIGDMISSAELFAHIEREVEAGAQVLVAHEAAEKGPREFAKLANAPRIWCVIGPEGGISGEEVGQLSAAGAQAVSLGQHVLRSVTAGTVAAALIRAVTASQ